jgi:hypothetical protein
MKSASYYKQRRTFIPIIESSEHYVLKVSYLAFLHLPNRNTPFPAHIYQTEIHPSQLTFTKQKYTLPSSHLHALIMQFEQSMREVIKYKWNN